MKRSIQKGFTLIELMIVVAIIGILASVALPAYQTYTYKAQMSEVILAASSCRTVVTEQYMSGGSAPAANNWGCEGGSATTAASYLSKYVAEVTTSANGAVRVQLAVNTMGLTGTTNYVFLEPMSDTAGTTALVVASLGSGVPKAWRCGSHLAAVRKILPASCNYSYTSALF